MLNWQIKSNKNPLLRKYVLLFPCLIYTNDLIRKTATIHKLSASMKPIFVAASHQTRLDTRAKARRPIIVGKKGKGRSGTSRDSNPGCLCCSSAHLVQCEPDEASSFTNRNVGPGTYAS